MSRVLSVVALAVALALVTAIVVTSQEASPSRIAFLARADNPVDALAAGPVAAQIGGVVLLTGSESLDPEALAGLNEFAPDLVVLVGGTAAISDQVALEVSDAGYMRRRVSGVGRTATARALVALLEEYGTQAQSLEQRIAALESSTGEEPTLPSGTLIMVRATRACPPGFSSATDLNGGRFARGGTSSEQGGSMEHSHSIPGHSHGLGSHTHSINSHTHSFFATTDNAQSTFSSGFDEQYADGNGSHDHGVSGTTASSPSASTGASSGSSTDPNIGAIVTDEALPPYVTVRYCERE